MVKATQSQLQNEASRFLKKEVISVGLFDVSINHGKRDVRAIGLAAVNAVIYDSQNPIMVVAVTQREIYLLGWKGTHYSGSITKELQTFNRTGATIKSHTRDITMQRTVHTIEISEDGNAAKIHCIIHGTRTNQKMQREVINVLHRMERLFLRRNTYIMS